MALHSTRVAEIVPSDMTGPDTSTAATPGRPSSEDGQLSSNDVSPVMSTVWPSTTKDPATLSTLDTGPSTLSSNVTELAVPVVLLSSIVPCTSTYCPALKSS